MRGRERLQVCAAGLHRMTDGNRRWRVYTKLDGSTVLLSDGCRRCNAERQALRRCEHRQAQRQEAR